MNEIPTEKLLPQGLKDMLNAKRKCMAQANDIHNEVIDREMGRGGNKMKRKPIPKKIRQQVYQKYNGHCAYCGCELEYKDMQVDHVESVYLAKECLNKEVDDSIENYMPSCRMCNYYKDTGTIEQFRNNLTDMLMRNVRRPFDYRLALKYGLIKEDIKPILFYFERKEKQQ